MISGRVAREFSTSLFGIARLGCGSTVVLEFRGEVAGKSHAAFQVAAEFNPKGVRLCLASGTVMRETQVRDGGKGHARTQPAHTA
jgi:hypothetical protein